MDDKEKARIFAENLNSDGRYEGDEVTLSGCFHRFGHEGIEKASGSQFQLVVHDDLALVAILPPEFVPKEGAKYQVRGILGGAGVFDACPGIKLKQVETFDGK